MNVPLLPSFVFGLPSYFETGSFTRVPAPDSWYGGGAMNKTRIALLGTIADLHQRPIRYDLDALSHIVADARPDLLGVEIERDEFEREDFIRRSRCARY